jgi:hypothetical protein
MLLDAYLYTDMQPFYPLTQNPLLNPSMFSYFEIYFICTISFIIALAMYGIILWRQHKTASQMQD